MLNLSNNKHLTWVSLHRLLLHRPSLIHLDIYNCDNIFKYFNIDPIKLPEESIKSFTISSHNDDDNKCLELLKKIWREKHKEKAGFTQQMQIIQFFIL